MSEQLPVPYNPRLSTFSPRRKAAFLSQLAETGNVRLGCRAANISPQTAYRARRQSPVFARAWDAALLAARPIAEATLADRALNGIEVPVFYHGEEVATRTSYDTRLLLAHLGRLDRIESSAAMAGAVSALDTQIATLEGGAELEECDGPVRNASWTPAFAGDHPAGDPDSGDPEEHHNPVPGVPSVQFDPAEDEYSDDELPELERRLRAMEAARPREARKPHRMAHTFEEAGDIEALQLEAFEAGEDNWWEVTPARCELEEGQDGQPIGQIENEEERSSESLCLDPQTPGERSFDERTPSGVRHPRALPAQAQRPCGRPVGLAAADAAESQVSGPEATGSDPVPTGLPGGRVEGAGGSVSKKAEVEVADSAEDHRPDSEANSPDPTPPTLPVGWLPVKVSAKPRPPHAGWIPQAQWRAQQKASQEAGD